MEMAFHIPERNDGYYANVYNFPVSFVIVMYRENKEKLSGLFMSPIRFLKTLFKFCVRVFELCRQQRELSTFLLHQYTTVEKCKYNQRNLGTL